MNNAIVVDALSTTLKYTENQKDPKKKISKHESNHKMNKNEK